MNNLTMEIIEDFLNVRKEKLISIEMIENKEIRKIVCLNKKFIIKIDDVKRIEKEFHFFNIYNDKEIYEQMIYYDLKKGYIVYEYIESNECNNVENWGNIINVLKENMRLYKKYEKIYDNLLYCNSEDWLIFLKRNIVENLKYYSPNIEEIRGLKKSFEYLKNCNVDIRIVHGDLGIYNILISRNDERIRIIDPYPIAGDANYDILTFFCSSVKILNYFGLEYIINFLEGDKQKNLSLFIIVLYLRVCIESKHKIHNIDNYKEKLKELIKMGEGI